MTTEICRLFLRKSQFRKFNSESPPLLILTGKNSLTGTLFWGPVRERAQSVNKNSTNGKLLKALADTVNDWLAFNNFMMMLLYLTSAVKFEKQFLRVKEYQFLNTYSGKSRGMY